jgi:mannose-6-phosphate isomerase-like protein (cupin superfamily)/ketosteroid isomerase-like protein
MQEDPMRGFAFCVATVVAMSIEGQEALTPEQQVLRAEQEWVDATLAGDVDRFASFMGDEYVALVKDGKTFDKATWVSDLRLAKTKYESVNLSNLVVHVYGDTAVVRGDFTQKATGNHPTAAGKYVDTWVKRAGKWQVVASGFSTIPPSVPAEKRVGYVLQPDEGEPLILCKAANLRVNIKASPATTAVRDFAVGTADLLDGSNYGTHNEEDEVSFFISGEGIGTIGNNNFPIRPGTTMYVPRGVRHGFKNTGTTPLTFVWTISPAGLEERFRAGGHPPGGDCAQHVTK